VKVSLKATNNGINPVVIKAQGIVSKQSHLTLYE